MPSGGFERWITGVQSDYSTNYQCDQMASLFVQYSAIYKIENAPNSIKTVNLCLKFGP